MVVRSLRSPHHPSDLRLFSIHPLPNMSRLSIFGGNAGDSSHPAGTPSRFSLPASTSSSAGATPSPAPPPAGPKQRQPSYLSSQLNNLSISSTPAAPPPLTSIVDRPVNRMRGAEVGMAAWAFLYSGIVAYSQSRVDSVVDLEKRWVCVEERGWVDAHHASLTD